VTSVWSRYLAGSVVLSLAHLALPIGGLRALAYQALAVSVIVAMVAGIRRNATAQRRSWYLLAAGFALMVAGDGLFSFYDVVLHVDPFPSAADALYLASYPLVGAGLLGLARARGSERHPTAAIDSLLMSVGLGLLVWVLLIAPAWREPEVDVLSASVGSAYPVADVLLLGLLVRLLTAPGARSPASVLLISSCALLLTVDALFQVASFLPFVAARELWLDALWLVAYALAAAAMLHPGMRRLSDRTAEPEQRHGRQRLLLVGPAVLMAPSVLLVEVAIGGTVDVLACTFAAIALTVLSLVRMARMTRWLEEQATRLRDAADTDLVTGLANRRRLIEALRHSIEGRRSRVALVVVDVDRFGEINETFGHRTGDAVLRRIGEHLSALAGADGLVSRPGGDEFAVLFTDVADDAAAALLAQSVHDALTRPIDLDGLEVRVQASVGLVVAPDDGTEALDLLHRADVALSTAKRGTREPARYDASMSSGSALAPMLAGSLHDAIGRGELVLHFQPIVEVATGRVLAVEALVRWQHPEHGLLAPYVFVPTAERTGLIGPLTRDVLDQALRAVAAWRADGLDIAVAVNLSAQNLQDPGLVTDVRDALARHGVPVEALELEITESSAMSDPLRALEALDALAGLGIALAVDDYGTGHSSLAYLQRLPVAQLKLDRTFISRLTVDSPTEAIVRSTIELAQHLRLAVVAEGVEDDATFAKLRTMGCFAAQGFGLARPGPAETVPGMVEQIRRRFGATVPPVAVEALVEEAFGLAPPGPATGPAGPREAETERAAR
jgi:diguanylate cyclase (GGDEF)-like protein